jgi:Zn-finger in ubiquitin-hydrolases and other protein
MNLPCPHFAAALADVPPPLDVCPRCVEMGAKWVHLRQCLICGQTGCCDNSPNRHATAHARETGHALIRSAQPDEQWAWCYPDEAFFVPGDDGGWELFEE